jgi:hypothetical protein
MRVEDRFAGRAAGYAAYRPTVRWPLSLRVGRVARRPEGRYHPATS